MAVHRDYKGQEDDDPGRWFPYKIDPDSGVLAEMRVRKLSRDVGKRFNRDWEEPVDVVVKNKVEKRMEIPEDKTGDFWNAVVDWMWVDVRNFFVVAQTKRAVAFYHKEVGDTSIKINVEFSLDGRLTPSIKTYLLEELGDVTEVITKAMERKTVEVVVDADRRKREREEALSANLQSGSTSNSTTPTSPKAEKSVEPALSLGEAKASPALTTTSRN